jgi:hypothetical protein
VCVVALRVGSTLCCIAWLCYIGNVYSSTEMRVGVRHGTLLADQCSAFRRRFVESTHKPLKGKKSKGVAAEAVETNDK